MGNDYRGVLLRKKSKRFDRLSPEAMIDYNISLISKTMGIAIVRMDFEDSL